VSQLKDNAVVSVFGSREPQPGSALYESSKKLGHLLAKAGFVVATGGYEGTMAAISQGAAEAGGLTIGVTSAAVEASRDTSANRWIGQEIRFETLHDRLYHLVTENQAMVVLDGGIGTLSEFTLAWSLIQVGEIEERPLVIMGQLWKEILPLFMNSDYVPERSIQLVRIVDTPAEVVAVLKSYKTQGNREAE
jgi:uncharacterized protein (TIGR00730 family)